MSQASIGKKIKKHRDMEEISLEELSRRSGLDTDFIRSVEEDDIYPSLGPLLKIARGLGVRLGTFLDDTVVQDPLIVREKDRQEELTMLKGKEKPAALRFYSLGKGKSDRKMEPFFIEVFPEPPQDKKLSSHEGEEFIIVVAGEIELVYGHETHVLKAGDSVYYNSIVPHNVSARGEGPARIYAVLYFPE
ncbi:transcriptional regulator, XRE family [Desulfonatronospira thiodismutans ASO3-1]|uniref:Transcriptional regulator, XRE family n=1 Tax=Desulfonatronospira thiodismutans ASO3-1 TaxID=555779 RepID=D6SLV3_9BACT|nr:MULTISPECIES: cupin domain-containing protein [Desulfonatronospira]EFI35664.1 transcriptional regulator, XRE family [Desulfonatronospira thiodismutans ASO3-1]RQD74256.1 MAG: cupin domain-containing protein [Desulfonatronospira sp. MSAO_Bac3]